MSLEALTQMPAALAAGETLKVQRSYADFKASDGWVVTFYFVNASAAPFNQACTAEGDDHLLTVPAATTATKTAGTWYFEARAVLAGEVKLAESGKLEITANFSTIASPSDQRDHAQKVLDAVNAVMEGRASTDQEEYTVKGRMLKRTPLADLIKLRSYYASLVASAALKASGRNRSIFVEFP